MITANEAYKQTLEYREKGHPELSRHRAQVFNGIEKAIREGKFSLWVEIGYIDSIIDPIMKELIGLGYSVELSRGTLQIKWV